MVRARIPTIWFVTAALVLAVSVAAASSARGQSNCVCRYAGQSYAQSTCVCIVTPDSARMACCDKVLNNSSWTFTGDGCPIAAVPDRSPTQSIAGRLRPAAPESWRQDGRWYAAATAVSGLEF